VSQYLTRQFSFNTDQVTNFKVKVRIVKESYLDLLEGEPAAYLFRPGMTANADIIKTKKMIDQPAAL
jgi:HlyD family secretion protein